MTSEQQTQRVPVVVPRRLGRWTLGERLGEGGMGVVWRAEDDQGRLVAIKVMREHIAHDEQARERLRREVRTLARVHHPRVAAVIDADVDGPAPYVVTEYVPGRPLDRVVEERGPLRGEDLLRLGRGLGEALGAIHGAGIVHRDLKPGNVMLVEGPAGGPLEPVVIDFGIAQVADDVRLTATGLVMGTPGYLSPEVVEGGQVGEATDWWGWAATIAFAAAGEPPFGTGPMSVVLDRVVRGRTRLPGVDPELRPLLLAALDPEPTRRPTAAEVLDGLERYARHEDVTGALPGWSRTTPDATRMQPLAETRMAPLAETRPAPQVREPQPWINHTRQAPAVAAVPFTPDVTPAPAGAAAYPDGGVPAPQPPAGAHADPRIGRSRRSLTLTAMLVAFVGLASVAPLVGWGAFALWGILARTVDGSVTGLVLRRYETGPRRSDIPMMVLASPFHLLGAVLSTALSLILPLAMTLLAALVFAGALTSTASVVGVDVEHPFSLAFGSMIGGWLAWWGLASTSLRRGSRTLVRAILPGGTPALVVGALLAAGGVSLVLWAYASGQSASWWPLPPDFDLRDLLPGELDGR